MDYKSESYSELHPVLKMDWPYSIFTIDLKGQQLKQELESAYAPTLDPLYISLAEREDDLRLATLALEQATLGTPLYSDQLAKVVTAQAAYKEAQANLDSSLATLQSKLKAVEQPIYIQRQYNQVVMRDVYNVAVEDALPSIFVDNPALLDFYKDVTFSIYVQKEFNNIEYTGFRVASYDPEAPEYRANDFKGWERSQQHYQIVFLYLGRLSSSFNWRIIFTTVVVSPYLTHIQADMKLLTQRWADKNEDGLVEVVASSDVAVQELNELFVTCLPNELAVMITGVNIRAWHCSASKEKEEQIVLGVRTPVRLGYILIETIKPVKISKDKLSEQELITDLPSPPSNDDSPAAPLYRTILRDVVQNPETSANITFYGQYWEVDSLDMLDDTELPTLYTDQPADAPPGMVVKSSFANRLYYPLPYR